MALVPIDYFFPSRMLSAGLQVVNMFFEEGNPTSMFNFQSGFQTKVNGDKLNLGLGSI
jgi:hypothetical protein